MALFKRSKNNVPDMPRELQSYYQSETRQKSWVAWLLGLATLAITVLLALALFFGGRWIYRKIRHQDRPNTSQVQNESEQSQDGSESSESQEQTTGTSSTTNGSTIQPATPNTSSTNTSTSSSATTAPSTTTQTSSTALPNTGPADTLAIFLAVTVLAYAAHRRYSSAR